MTTPPGPIGRSQSEIGAHGRARRALQDQIGAVHAHDLRRGVATLAHVTHHDHFGVGDIAAAVPTQDGTRIERVHVRVATACERL
jgi:hypothetical protein